MRLPLLDTNRLSDGSSPALVDDEALVSPVEAVPVDVDIDVDEALAPSVEPPLVGEDVAFVPSVEPPLVGVDEAPVLPVVTPVVAPLVPVVVPVLPSSPLALQPAVTNRRPMTAPRR